MKKEQEGKKRDRSQPAKFVLIFLSLHAALLGKIRTYLLSRMR